MTKPFKWSAYDDLRRVLHRIMKEVSADPVNGGMGRMKKAIIFREAYIGDIVTADDIHCPRNKLEEWLLRVPIFRKAFAKIAKKNTVRKDYNIFEERIHPIGVWDGNGGVVLFTEKPVWDVDVED